MKSPVVKTIVTTVIPTSVGFFTNLVTNDLDKILSNHFFYILLSIIFLYTFFVYRYAKSEEIILTYVKTHRFSDIQKKMKLVAELGMVSLEQQLIEKKNIRDKAKVESKRIKRDLKNEK